MLNGWRESYPEVFKKKKNLATGKYKYANRLDPNFIYLFIFLKLKIIRVPQTKFEIY